MSNKTLTQTLANTLYKMADTLSEKDGKTEGQVKIILTLAAATLLNQEQKIKDLEDNKSE